MNELQAIAQVENMDVFTKTELYMNYYITMLSLKYNFEIVDLKNISKSAKNISPYHGMGKPNKEFKNIAFYFLWENIKIKTFEEFCSKSNVVINDTGCDDWKERGFASKSWVTLQSDSIYNYVYLKL